MICKSCGTLNDNSMSFCNTCGAPLETGAPVNERYSQQNNFQQSQPMQQPVLPPKKKKGGKIAIIIVAVILVLCLCPLGIIGAFAGISAIIGINMTNKAEDLQGIVDEQGIVNELEDYDVNDYFDTEDVVDEEYYEDFDADNIVNELEDYDVNDYFDTEDNNDVATDYSESAIDYSDYTGFYMKDGGDPEWGPCYSVYLSEFDSVNKTATFSVDYIGTNASPYYSTGPITVDLDDFNSAEFTWEDSWLNSGSGSIRFVDGDEPVIELEMIQEVTADWNRASLATNGVMELYFEY